MPNRRETTITNELVNILRNMRHGWEIETEVNAFIKGNSELDALAIERGREPIGIEAKFATTTNAKNLIKQAETRLVHELEAEYYAFGKTLNNVMAILYPDRFKTMQGKNINPQLRESRPKLAPYCLGKAGDSRWRYHLEALSNFSEGSASNGSRTSIRYRRYDF